MITFSCSNYKKSITSLRHSLGVGVPANRGEGNVAVRNGTIIFRFRIKDLYLTHRKTSLDDVNWREIKSRNYSQMKFSENTLISGGNIRSALQVPHAQNANLMRVIVATSEAARSQVVYQIVQQMLKSSRSLTWSEIEPLLIGTWIFNIRKNHKRRPIQSGALGSRDYYRDREEKKRYPEKIDAIDAMKLIRDKGFHID